MKVKYDQDADAVYFYLLDTEIVDSEEIYPGIVYDFDKNDQVVGVEVLAVKHRSYSEFLDLISSEESLLSSQQKKELRRGFSELLFMA